MSLLVLLAWLVAMAAVINRSYLQASTASLATDLARYGSAASWRGVYYRGEKIGFTVSQTVPTDAGFDLEESGRPRCWFIRSNTFVRLVSWKYPPLPRRRRLASGMTFAAARQSVQWFELVPQLVPQLRLAFGVGFQVRVASSARPLRAGRACARFRP